MSIKNIFSVFFFTIATLAFAQLDRSKLPKPATPRPIEIGQYETFELKNGLKVYVIENHKLPRVTYFLSIDRERVMQGDKTGYLSMVGQMMRRGTGTRTKEQLDEEIDFIGASISATSSNVFASGLSKYDEQIMELMTDIAFNPIFPQQELEKLRTQVLSRLAANKESPDYIAENVNRKLVYGANHPYGEITTEETVNNVTVDDLVQHHKKYFIPNISYLAVVGDVNFKDVKKLVKTYFGNWEPADVEMSPYEKPTAPEKNQVNLVNRPNAVQSVISVTYPVYLPFGSEDEIKVRVMNQILGGSFSGKLNMNLREDKGYTYGSRSSIQADELMSQFTARASVRNEVSDSAIVQIFYEMEQMRKGEISDEELELAKNAISGDFSRSLENPRTIGTFALNVAIRSYPDDYYTTYLQQVQAVTLEDVLAMVEKYLKPENAYINIVGKADDIAEKLASFGDLKYYDVYGNEVDPSLAKIPEGVTVESILNKYKEALGGQDAISKIENVTLKMTAETSGQTFDMERIAAKGMKSRTTLSMTGMTIMSAVTDGEKASVTQMGNKMPLDEQTAEERIVSSALFGEFMLADIGAKLELAGVQQIDGKDAYGIKVDLSKGGSYTIYFEAETGLKAKYVAVQETPQGAITESITYGDYKEVGGVLFYHSTSQQSGPQKINSTVLEIMVNQNLPEDTFEVE